MIIDAIPLRNNFFDYITEALGSDNLELLNKIPRRPQFFYDRFNSK